MPRRGEGTPAPPGRGQRWVSGQLPRGSSDRDRWRQGWPRPHAGVWPCPAALPWPRALPSLGAVGRSGSCPGSVPGLCRGLGEAFPPARGAQPGLEAFATTGVVLGAGTWGATEPPARRCPYGGALGGWDGVGEPPAAALAPSRPHGRLMAASQGAAVGTRDVQDRGQGMGRLPAAENTRKAARVCGGAAAGRVPHGAQGG